MEPAVAFPVNVATNPAGKFMVPIPVAPVVVNTILGFSGWLRQTVALGAALVAVMFGLTVIVPEAVILPHPPVKGIL
jgi:hypothetical protein